MQKIVSILSMLKIVQQRPQMYFWRNSIYDLLAFERGYFSGISGLVDGKIHKVEESYKFNDYIIEQTIGQKSAKSEGLWAHECLLKVCNGDEEKAYNLFFELLDKFIEEEGVEIEVPYPKDK